VLFCRALADRSPNISIFPVTLSADRQGRYWRNQRLDRPEPNTDQILDSAASGDADARGRLLDRHRSRLRRMLAVRLDPRLSPRVDASDLVQDVLAEAARRLDSYLAARPLPFYPWLRQIAVDQLGMAHRRHLRAGGRAIGKELPGGLPEGSAMELAGRFSRVSAGPSQRLRREEERVRVRSALDRLAVRDREVLVLRYLEDLSTAEVAAVLGLSEGAVKMRLLRAIQRLHGLVGGKESS
jgi:RNA polymerase sigma-70 factor (ECF subfamily)